MNRDNMQLWIDALRSGNYKQTTGTLRRINSAMERSYCCLGVLCEVYGTATATDVEAELEDAALLPNRVASWLDLDEDDLEKNQFGHCGLTLGTPPNSLYRVSATTANDSGIWDFNQIADQLERYYLGQEPANAES